MQPGWREVLVKRRFMPALTVNHALVTAGTTGRPEVSVPSAAGLFIAGDWVGAEGQLADVSVASAVSATQQVVLNQ